MNLKNQKSLKGDNINYQEEEKEYITNNDALKR